MVQEFRRDVAGALTIVFTFSDDWSGASAYCWVSKLVDYNLVCDLSALLRKQPTSPQC
jgi:hypothetical protein